MAPKAKPLWVLVTDGGTGRLLKIGRSTPGIEQVADRKNETRQQPSRDLASDASGRDFDASGPVSHSKQPRTDPHDQAEEEFVRGWVDVLEHARNNNQMAQLMLVADPRSLGHLRKHMGEPLKQCVTGENALNLANLDVRKLEKRLRSLAGWTA